MKKFGHRKGHKPHFRAVPPTELPLRAREALEARDFREGFIFGRVIRRRIVRNKPYKLIDANGNAVDIPANDFQEALLFRDPRNTQNDILFLQNSINSGWPWILHGAFGIKPQQIRVYLRFPRGEAFPGRFPNVDPIRPRSGDDLGYFDELDSPFEEPTDFIEVTIPPQREVEAEFFNVDLLRAHQPRLNILFSVYWFQIWDPEVPEQAKIINDIALQRRRAKFLTVGFADMPIDAGTKLLKDWGAKPITLDVAMAC